MKTLEELRREIDTLDEELLHILAKRTDVVREIGKLKQREGLPLLDEKRREEMLETIAKKTESLHLAQDFIKKLYVLIHDHSVTLEKKV